MSKDRLTRITRGILYMKVKPLAVANHDIMLRCGCDCAIEFVNTVEVTTVKKSGR